MMPRDNELCKDRCTLLHNAMNKHHAIALAFRAASEEISFSEMSTYTIFCWQETDHMIRAAFLFRKCTLCSMDGFPVPPRPERPDGETSGALRELGMDVDQRQIEMWFLD